MTQAQPKSSRRWLKIAALIIVVMVVIAGFLLWQVNIGIRNGFVSELSDDAAKTAIEEVTGLTLPASASDFHFYSISFMSSGQNVDQMRFSIPAQNSDVILNRRFLCLYGPLQPVTWTAREHRTNFDWWRPNTAQTKLGGRCSLDWFTAEVLIDTTDPQTWIVYISTTQ